MPRPEPPALEPVLRALGDPTRRRILQLLHAQPGLTTSELGGLVPGLTRWGVMKHLDVLRDAGLVQTLTDGRRRRHYREDAPLQVVYDWLEDQLRER